MTKPTIKNPLARKAINDIFRIGYVLSNEEIMPVIAKSMDIWRGNYITDTLKKFKRYSDLEHAFLGITNKRGKVLRFGEVYSKPTKGKSKLELKKPGDKTLTPYNVFASLQSEKYEAKDGRVVLQSEYIFKSIYDARLYNPTQYNRVSNIGESDYSLVVGKQVIRNAFLWKSKKGGDTFPLIKLTTNVKNGRPTPGGAEVNADLKRVLMTAPDKRINSKSMAQMSVRSYLVSKKLNEHGLQVLPAFLDLTTQVQQALASRDGAALGRARAVSYITKTLNKKLTFKKL